MGQPSHLGTRTETQYRRWLRPISDVAKIDIVQSGGVALVDGSTHTVSWITDLAQSVSVKAIGNGVVAVGHGSQLSFLSEATGSQLQSWTAPSAIGDLILTDNLAFVVTSTFSQSNVHAIEIATGREVWSDSQPRPNSSATVELALGSGHLLLSG